MVDGIHNEPNEPEQGHKQDEHGQVPVDYSHRTKTNQALAQNMDSVTGIHSMNYDGKCMTEVYFSHDNEKLDRGCGPLKSTRRHGPF